MASLRVLEEQPSRLVLGKGGSGGLGSLIGIIIFGVIALAGLASMFEDGGGFNPVLIVIVLVIGLSSLVSLINSLTSTRVTLDADQKQAARVESILFFPTRQQTLPFNLIREVEVSSPNTPDALRFEFSPTWQVAMRAADGSSLIVNDRGTRAEMNMLAEQVGTLVSRPVKTASSAAQSAASSTTFTPAGVIGALTENLAGFAQSLGTTGTASVAPTISLFPDDSPRSNRDADERQSADAPFLQASARMTAKQAAAGAPRAATNLQMAADRAAAFSSDVQVQSQMGAEQLAAGTPFTQASARLAQEQAQAQAAMGFSMPSLLTMPQMPPMMSMGPSLNMPSFAPMGVAFDLMMSAPPLAAETKHVEAHESETAADTGTLFVQARKLLGARNYRDAEQAFLRALSTNPADAASHNDLGIVYYAENKLRDAENAFRRAMALDPFNNQARYNLGLALDRMGKRSEAQEVFRVGAQTAGRGSSKHFQEALRGVLHEPLTSSR